MCLFVCLFVCFLLRLRENLSSASGQAKRFKSFFMFGAVSLRPFAAIPTLLPRRVLKHFSSKTFSGPSFSSSALVLLYHLPFLQYAELYRGFSQCLRVNSGTLPYSRTRQFNSSLCAVLSLAQQSNAGQGRLILEVSKSHTITHQSR